MSERKKCCPVVHFNFQNIGQVFFFLFVCRPWDQGQGSTTKRPFIQSVRPEWNQPNGVQKILQKETFMGNPRPAKDDRHFYNEGAMSTGTPWRLLQDWRWVGVDLNLVRSHPKCLLFAPIFYKMKKNNTFPDAHTHEKISTWMTYCHFFKKKTTKSNFHISHFWGSSLLPCLSCWDRIQLAFFYTFVTFYVFYRIFSWAKIPSCIRNLLSLVFWFHFICFVCWRRSEIFWQSGGKHPLTFSQEKKKKNWGEVIYLCGRHVKRK